MNRTRCTAPAKINLSLRVIARRRDGFHLIDSLMVPVDLIDEIVVDTAFGVDTSVAVSTTDPAVPDGPANLAHQAAARFLAATGTTAQVNIHIRKGIPMGAGLGGGSSDAAGVLWALNSAADSPLSTHRLAALGAEVGSDVPFFIHRSAARVRGVGNLITPIEIPCELALVLCSTGASVATRTVYSHVDLSLTSGPGPTSIRAFVTGQKPISELLVNDLEAAVAQIHPEVLSVKSTMARLGASCALMSGSGSACFGIWSDRTGAEMAARALRAEGLWAHATRTLSEW